jgi:glycosyltransferase involved in cell wall biosynthesis
MRLVVQIPCHNEAHTLPAVLADLPRTLPLIDEVLVVVVDDGSTDGTAEIATRLGVAQVVRHSTRRGLAAAFQSGINAALALGADVVCNTDGDHQYPGRELARVVDVVVRGEADLALGDRGATRDRRLPWSKRLLSRLGNWVVRSLTGATVRDAPSGLRALSSELALRLYLTQGFSHTIETIVLASAWGLRIAELPIATHAPTRPSRLFARTHSYLLRSAAALLRGYASHRPLRAFGWMSVPLFGVALALGCRFLWHFLQSPGESRHVQSLILAAICAVVGTQTLFLGVLADTARTNRLLLEELRYRQRRAEWEAARARRQP